MVDTSRILIIRPSALGDVCRTVPVLASLRKAFPAAEIDWIVQDSFVEAIASHPALSAAIPFPRATFGRWWKSLPVAGQLKRWANDLRRREYELVFDCQGLGRSGLIAWCTRSQRRIGYRDAREMGWLGCTIRHDVPRDLHTVDRMLALLEAEGIAPVKDLRLYVPEEATQWWQERRGGIVGADERYVVLAPSARWPSKRWPASRFSQIITPLLDRGFDRVLLIGSPDEVDQVRPVRMLRHSKSDRVIDLTGETSIGQTMAVLSGASLVIANDSAPLHMALGLNRMGIGLFGPTDPAMVGPYQKSECVIRIYHPHPGESINFKDPRLGDSLMRFIDPTHVIDKVDELCGMTRPTGPARPLPPTPAEVVTGRMRQPR